MTPSEQTNIELTLADAVILERVADQLDRDVAFLARRGIDCQDIRLATTDARRLAARIREAEAHE